MGLVSSVMEWGEPGWCTAQYDGVRSQTDVISNPSFE